MNDAETSSAKDFSTAGKRKNRSFQPAKKHKNHKIITYVHNKL